MNPKPGWVRYMENIYAMLKRVDFLNDVVESERIKAAEILQKEIRAFIAHYGQVSTAECPSTWHSYVLLCDGNILVRKDEYDEGKEVEVIDLSLQEMGFLREFMVDTINHNLQCQEGAIDRYTHICL